MSLPTLLLKGNLIETGYSDKKEKLDEYRPIDYIIEFLEKRVNKQAKSVQDRILIVRSSTGSGKSTVMPSEIYHTQYDKLRRTIVCTQPRVFNAVSIPTEQIIPYNTKDKIKQGRQPLVLEENIGYQTKAFTKKPTKGLLFMTIGVLAQQIKIFTPEEFMQQYSIIIIDEAHERSIDTDFTLMFIKKFIQQHINNQNCPFLITTSATFDPFKFADYLLSDIKQKNERYKNIIDVSGFSHPIQDTFLQYPTNDLIQEAADTALKLHTENNDDIKNNEKFRDILIFVSGAGEIKKIKQILEGKNDKNFIVLSVTRQDIQGESDDFQNMTRSYHEIPGKPERRIMIATNVGETGITYPNLKYVIDTGFHNSSEFDPTTASSLLINKPVTKSMYRQRRGRSGRNAPGFSFPLYTEETYNKFLEDAYPEIIREDISHPILTLISGGDKSFNIQDVDLLDPPTPDSWTYTIEKLFTLGAIDKYSNPTKIGQIMANMSGLRLESLRMILAGYAWGACIQDLIILACFLEEKRKDIYPRLKDPEQEQEFKEFQKQLIPAKYKPLMDDSLQHILTFHTITSNNNNQKGKISPAGINPQAIDRIVVLQTEIATQLAANNLNPYHNWQQNAKQAIETNDLTEIIQYMTKIKQCIFEGYKMNLATKTDNATYITKRSHTQLKLQHFHFENAAKYIIFDNIFYMRNQETNIYEPQIDNIFILDGFVSI